MALIVALVTLQFAGSQFVTQRQEISAIEINLAGRQRMLSQRIAWTIHRVAALPEDASPTERAYLQGVLAVCVDLMESSQRALAARALRPMQRVLQEGAPCLTPDPEIPNLPPADRAALEDDSILATFTQQAWLVATGDIPGEDAREVARLFEQPLVALLGQLDQATLAAQEGSTQQIRRLLSFNWFLILGLVLGEIILIFRPMAKAVECSINNLREANALLSDSETKLQDFAATAAHQFWETDPEHRFTYVAAANPNTQLVKSSTQLGKPLWEQDGISPVNLSNGWDDHRATLDAQRAFTGVEYSITRPHGPKTWWRTNGRAIFTPDGTFKGYRGTSSEITKERDAEEKLRISERMMAVGQLTAGVAHDFNNILAVIQGNAELFAEEKSDAARERTVNEIVAAVRRGASLTSRLLAFGRVQSLTPEAIEVSSFLTALQMLLNRTLGENFQVSIAQPVEPLFVLADRHQLEDACLNLAINARDAAVQSGRLHIQAMVERVSVPVPALSAAMEQGGLVKLSFQDNGRGIPSEIHERIFEPFFTTKPVSEGSGLGLSMVYGFALQSGGFVDVASDVGKGTIIDLYLPRALGEHADNPEEIDGRPAPIVEGMSILLVEDNDALREVVHRQLRHLGLRVTEAHDGGSAIEKLRDKGRFDLMLIDIVLPGGIDGVEVAHHARELSPDTLVLFCTGFAGARAGTRDAPSIPGSVLAKPFSAAQLNEALGNLIANKATETGIGNPAIDRA
ncbi:MAG: ATP-binding protein [Pseudomonadota bacterium]